MKLIVQIPCFNESQTLPETVADIPREIDGIDRVELLVVDDGSRDDTAQLARELGVEHVVRHRTNRGLARSFATGIDAALKAGADIIVNTDGDNQYCGADIATLVQPIVNGTADIVIGDRQTWNSSHFSFFKRILQHVGSRVVRRLSATSVPDAVSGFRAFSKEAAIKLNVVTSFSYTIETLIQAGRGKMAVAWVPVRTNAKTRPSRLFSNIPQFLRKSGATMLRAYALHRPLSVFFALGSALFAVGSVPIGRFLYFALAGNGNGHVQSLILGCALAIMGTSAWIVGLLADLIAANRQLLEVTLEKVRRLELELANSPDRLQAGARVAAVSTDEAASPSLVTPPPTSESPPSLPGSATQATAPLTAPIALPSGLAGPPGTSIPS